MTRVAASLLKLRRLFRCDLRRQDQVAYLLDALCDGLGLGRAGIRRYRLQGGGAVFLRGDSTDRKVFDEVFLEQIYAPGVALLPKGPSILVDLGANIGLSTLFFARRMNLTRIVAVEPCPENFRMLLENTRGLADRCTAHQAFAGAERGFAELVDAGFGAWGLRMGPSASRGTPVLPLSEILPQTPGARVVLKCDIEGSERHLFRSMRDWEHLVDFIILELHTEFFSAPELQHCLNESGFQWKQHGVTEPGAVLAVIGLERGRSYNWENDSRNTSRGAAAM